MRTASEVGKECRGVRVGIIGGDAKGQRSSACKNKVPAEFPAANGFVDKARGIRSVVPAFPEGKLVNVGEHEALRHV